MNLRFLAVPAVAFLAGLAGGWASRLVTFEKLSDLRYDPVRATRFDLVDKDGRTKAFIGTDQEGDTALVFLDDQMRIRAKFGVCAGPRSPRMVMRGGDGHERVTLILSSMDDRPRLALGDGGGPRVDMGFYENDVPSPKDEDWGVRFYPPHSNQSPLAAVGIHRDRDDKMSGFVFAQAEAGQHFYEPKH